MPIPRFLAELRRKVGTDLLLLPTVVVIARDDEGRLLVVLDRDSGQWTLPGGIVEPDQTPADAAQREVWEEAGMLVELTHLVGVVGGPECRTTYRNGDAIAWVATVFGARAGRTPPVADGDEVVVARLVDAPALAALELRADARRFLAAEGQGGPGAHFEPARWRPDQLDGPLPGAPR